MANLHENKMPRKRRDFTKTQFLFVDGEPTKMFRRSRQLVWLHDVSDDIILAGPDYRANQASMFSGGWRLAYIWTLIEVH